MIFNSDNYIEAPENKQRNFKSKYFCTAAYKISPNISSMPIVEIFDEKIPKYISTIVEVDEEQTNPEVTQTQDKSYKKL